MFSLPKGCNTLRTFCYDLKFGQLTLVAKRQSQSADLEKKILSFMKKRYQNNCIATLLLYFTAPLFMH